MTQWLYTLAFLSIFLTFCAPPNAFQKTNVNNLKNQTKNPVSVFPGPTPTPTVFPTPTPTPPQAMCQLPPMPECGNTPVGPGVWGCCTEHAEDTMGSVIEQAIAQIKVQHPEYFSGERVLNEDGYMLGVVAILQSYGYCATRGGPDDEVGIKTTNGFSEQYDILLGSGYIRHYGFTVTCTPARF